MKSQEAIKNKLRTAFLVHAEGHIRKHLANVEVLLSNPAGIGEHGDIVGEIAVSYTHLTLPTSTLV